MHVRRQNQINSCDGRSFAIPDHFEFSVERVGARCADSADYGVLSFGIVMDSCEGVLGNGSREIDVSNFDVV